MRQDYFFYSCLHLGEYGLDITNLEPIAIEVNFGVVEPRSTIENLEEATHLFNVLMQRVVARRFLSPMRCNEILFHLLSKRTSFCRRSALPKGYLILQQARSDAKASKISACPKELCAAEQIILNRKDAVIESASQVPNVSTSTGPPAAPRARSGRPSGHPQNAF